ncbi:MAG: class I SAM-dependent methyltransferase [Proteobacteria bacterium]|nr:class I SAM-dependent methyltransferase [Desulfobacula sp.]MBU4132934.1 class I SAM-dependent methyltransferase [Pseudomonadota bacterium]
MIKKATRRFHSLTRGIYTSLRKFRKGSDYKRWVSVENLSTSWDSRTEQIAKLIDNGTSVIEFGAGRLVLKVCLPDGCSYTPSDIVDRGSGTIICDLNREPLPNLQQYDLAVFSGVLEYVNDVPRLILYLSNYVDVIIASYAVTDLNESNRRTQGWVNDFSSMRFIELFENDGFQCHHIEEWKKQLIYKFRKKPNT